MDIIELKREMESLKRQVRELQQQAYKSPLRFLPPLPAGGDIRMAKTQEAADNITDNIISCKLVEWNGGTETWDETGAAFDVRCVLSGGTSLSAAIRHLDLGDYLNIYENDHNWWALEGFQIWTICEEEA
jgi:hypothetical protein